MLGCLRPHVKTFDRTVFAGDRRPRVLAHHSSEHVELKVALQIPGILDSRPTISCFDLDEHHTGVRSCITAARRTL